MMSSSWRWKVYFTLFSIVLSFYVLTPTLMGWNSLEKPDATQLSGTQKLIRSLFPTKTLNLGLDLRGGVYVELEMSVEEAVKRQLDSTASTLNRFLNPDNKDQVMVEAVPQIYRIRAVLPDNNTRQKLIDHIHDSYKDLLVEDFESQELSLQSDEKDEAKLQEQHQEILKAISEQPGVLDVIRTSHSPLFRVVLKPGTPPGTLLPWFTGRFSFLKEMQEPNRLFFKFSEFYVEKLRTDSVRQAIEIMRNRIDRFGVAEPSIRQLGENRIAVELPGVTDPDRAIEVIKNSGKLEFKLVDDTKPMAEIQTLIAQARKEKNIPEGYSAEIVNQLNEALKGKIPSDSEVLFEIKYDQMTKKISKGEPYLLKRKVEVTGDMLDSAQTQISDREGPYVSLNFNPTGKHIFGELTAASIGKRLAIILDGNVKMAPVIKSAIEDGTAMITFGEKNSDAALNEAEDLVLVLKEALPVSLKEITKNVVGPSLGKSVIHNSLIAALLAGITVIVFMMLYYKGAGLIADLVLIINVLLILGSLALFQATLTLPGIAGIVLTMGMALDASIIIFERIREELKSGRIVRGAVEAGFSNAWTAVFDTHLTTFISGLVLYYFGTGPIRGFAVTLMVGVLTTFFTAYLTTKLVFEYLIHKVKIQKVSI